MQTGRKGPRRHVGLTPDIPNRGRIRAPFRPGRRLELKEANVAGHVVVGPWVELTLAHRGIEKPVTGNAVSAGRIIDGRDDPLLPVCFASWKADDPQRPTNQGADQGSPLHEYRSI